MQKKTDVTALTVTTQENAIKKTFEKRFEIPLDFDFFKRPDKIVRFELNSSERVIL